MLLLFFGCSLSKRKQHVFTEHNCALGTGEQDTEPQPLSILQWMPDELLPNLQSPVRRSPPTSPCYSPLPLPGGFSAYSHVSFPVAP